MKFIVLFAAFAVAASAEITEQNDRFLLGVVAAILDHMKPVSPVIVDPAITEPLVPTPVAVVDNYEQIAVGPAIVDQAVDHPIEASPVIVAPAPVAPESPAPVFIPYPVFNGPLVHIMLNVNQNQPGAAAESPAVVEEVNPTPVLVEESAPVEAIEPTPVVVAEALPEPVIVAEPIVVAPVMTLPDTLN